MDQTKDCTRELIAKAHNNDKEAREKLVTDNLGLIWNIIKRFKGRGIEQEDLFQIGCIGLIKAIDNFNLDMDVAFSTYAVPMILGEIKRFLRDDGIIKVSRNVKSLAKKLHFDKEYLTKKLDRNPTIEELAEYSGIDKEEILFALESSASLQYLYDVIHHDDGSPVLLIDKLSENAVEDKNLTDRIALKEALKNLDNKSRQIIVLRYFKDKTQIEVAKMLGISQVQVSRIEKKVLGEMRKQLEEG